MVKEMSHYYQNDPNLKSKIKEINYDYRGEKLKLLTDSGVFSKERIDFGTNLLLNNIKPELDSLSVLDVGCGYGIIGLAIAKKYKNSKVHLVDVNLRAIELAEENGKLNNLSNINIYESNIYENVKEKFDVIITNPPIRAGKKIVHEIVLGSYDYLNDGGEIYVVIKKTQGAPSLIKEMEKLFFSVVIVEKRSGYYIVKGIKK